ncbi:MAG TPA: hypothetical protein VHB27_00520 [Rhodopila sp.]|uniref:hypothetical protein n=1 Tax=Rhodopila sp. TaxID=2480087 RepID=UPI002BA11F02|nr:hypothetical protein [Rhodopila sp.]HVY13678.1 hypothetical protein [Rhodopila sp.]
MQHPSLPLVALSLTLAACSVQDSHTARHAETRLVGLSAVDLESCLGVPNRRDTFGQTAILSYDGSSTSSGGLSLALPIVGDLSFSGGGDCHMTVRLDEGRVSQVRYSGETDATFAPDAYCAPLVRTCLKDLPPQSRPQPVTSAGSAPAPRSSPPAP